MGNSASSLPYTIGKQIVPSLNDGWSLHEGSRKSDGLQVSVFVAKKPTLVKTPISRYEPNINQYQPAKHHYIHCKKLRHPYILQVLATLDTDNPNDTTTTTSAVGSTNNTVSASNITENGDYVIVTESCIPIDEWLQKSNPSPDEIAWGLECIVKALHFLHTATPSAYFHANVSPSSFYVTKSGDVKLWNFSLTTTATTTMPPHFMTYEHLITPDLYRAPERKEKRYDSVMNYGIHIYDSYALGILIEHLYGTGNIPAKLIKAVQRLQTPNIKMRPKLLPLLKCPVFETPIQNVLLQIDELHIQPIETKILFYNATLYPALQQQHPIIIPTNVAVYKILPLISRTIETICTNDSMKTQDLYRREVQSTLLSLFFISESYLNKEQCNKQLGPLIKLLFQLNDRAVRGVLLQKIHYIESILDKDVLNTNVFEPMCSGFSDSSSALRELTLKATLMLVPHLTHPNLEKLARYLVRLQSDEESSIRTNTVIFFSKLAPYLAETTRQKMLLPVFMRAMKDPYTPCRNASIKSILKIKELFTPDNIASQVLPSITPQLLDPSSEVRKEAFQAVDEFLFVLKQESERLNFIATQQQQMQPGAGITAPVQGVVGPPPPSQQQASPASGGWGIASWIGSGKSNSTDSKPTTITTTTTVPTIPQQQQPSQIMVQQQQQRTMATPSAYGNTTTTTIATGIAATSLDDNWDDDGLGDDANGWDDDDLLDLNTTKVTLPPLPATTKKPTASVPGVAPISGNSSLFSPASLSDNVDNDEFFDAFEAKPTTKINTIPTIKKPVGKLVVPTKKVGTAPNSGGLPKLSVASKPSITKLSKDKDDTADGWDDF